MNVTTTLSTADDAYIIKNMYPLYLHDLSEFSGEGPNEHGIVEPSAIRTLAEQGDVQSIWWERPGKLFPFTILANGRAAGFAFIARPPHASPAVDYIMQEFFLLHAFRGAGIGERAASDIFDRFPGQWETGVLPKNLRAQAFWRRVLRRYRSGKFEEHFSETDGQRLVIFRFKNSTD